VAGGLRAELGYSAAMLRSLATLARSETPPASGALAGGVRESARMIAETTEQMQHFLARPRRTAVSPRFVPHLYDRLQSLGIAAAGPAAVAPDVGAPTGPLALLPFTADLLQAHIRRRVAPAATRMQATAAGVKISYACNHASATSWPLLLASLALRPWAWRVEAQQRQGEESIWIRPS